MQRLQHMLDTGTEHDDGSLSYRVTYHKKYVVGREVVDDAKLSLQLCPKKYRGPLAAEYFHDLDIQSR